MARKDVAALAELIAGEIARQGQEHDGLGDAESIVLMGELPTINLVELAEKLLAGAETCGGILLAREMLVAHDCRCPHPSAPASLRCIVCPIAAEARAPRICKGPRRTTEISCGAPNGVRIEQRCRNCPDRQFEVGAGLA